MKNTKLIESLKTLSRDELQNFVKYIYSPVFNGNSHLRKLIDLLGNAYPEFKPSNVDRQVLFSVLFPKRKYNEAYFNNLVSDLLLLLEDYLAYLVYERDEFRQRLFLAQTLRKCKLGNRYDRNYKLLAANWYNNNSESSEAYFNRYLINDESDAWFMSKGKRTHDENLLDKTENLTIFYLGSQLKSYCELLNRMMTIGTKTDVSERIRENLKLLDPMISMYCDFPGIAIYFTILKTLQEPELEKHFFRLMELLEEHEQCFPYQELQEMYQFAQNYCVRKINNGKQEFLNELFNLYQILLDKELIFEGGVLTHAVYKNITALGVRLKSYDWTEKFIHQYKNRLSEDIRENACNYNLAFLNFARGDYRKAVKQLVQTEFTDVFYSLDARSLLCMAYYELDEVEPLFSTLIAFRVFLQRNRLLSAQRKVSYLNFCRFVKKLANIDKGAHIFSSIQHAKRLNKLTESLNHIATIANRGWLKEKCDDL